MRRPAGAFELITQLDIDDLASWIAAIPFEDWPQQRRLDDGLIRPSMVTDLAWHSFGDEVADCVDDLMRHFEGCVAYQRMLSVVMPGHSIAPHIDEQGKSWRCRVHVPLLTNAKSFFWVEGQPHAMECGFAYRVDTTRQHAVTNAGETPRIHFMFDVGKPC